MDCPKSRILRFKVFGVHSDSGVNHSVLVGFEQFLSQNLTKHMFYSKEKNLKLKQKEKQNSYVVKTSLVCCSSNEQHK